MKNRLENVYKEFFKDSKISITTSSFYGNDNELWVRLFLAKDTSEVFNGIIENDIFNIIFKITLDGNNSVIENIHNRYHIKPTNKYLCYESKKVAFRKTQGNEDKIIMVFRKYVEKLHNALLDDLKNGNIHDNHLELVKAKML